MNIFKLASMSHMAVFSPLQWRVDGESEAVAQLCATSSLYSIHHLGVGGSNVCVYPMVYVRDIAPCSPHSIGGSWGQMG